MIYTIYTDGACRGNPGKGAYAWIIFVNDKKYGNGRAKFELTTNNRMELSAVISALDCVDANSEIHLYSDSMYVLETVNGRYRIKANKDLWDRYIEIIQRKKLRIITHNVKGHSGDIWNEWCDTECNKLLDNDDLASGFYLNFERGISA